MDSLKKTVLVTGAGGGIGRACVSLFASQGWQVIGVDRFPLKQLEGQDEFPVGCLFIQADISHPETAQQIFEQAQHFSPRLDALVNNAAVQVAKPIVDTTVEEWDAVMASNLRSVFLFVKLAHPLMKAAGGGAIVNVSSVHAIQTSANIAAYAASKGGIVGLTLARELLARGRGGAIFVHPVFRLSLLHFLFGFVNQEHGPALHFLKDAGDRRAEKRRLGRIRQRSWHSCLRWRLWTQPWDRSGKRSVRGRHSPTRTA